MKTIDGTRITFSTFSLKLATGNTPFSLYPFLLMGGAATDRRKAALRDDAEAIIQSRLPLICEIHKEIVARQVSGTPDKTITNYMYGLKMFFSWADDNGISPTLATLALDYLKYTRHLELRNRKKELSDASTFAIACTVSSIFDRVLGLTNGLLMQSRVKKPKNTPPWSKSQGSTFDAAAQEMGSALLKVCCALTCEFMSGPLPLEVQLATSKCIQFSPRTYKDAVLPLESGAPNILLLVEARRSMINFRIESEMLIFISQTGMNFEQARTQRAAPFRYTKNKKKAECLDVAVNYKSRKGGEVEFEIYSEYKAHFLRYLEFRAQIFPDDMNGPLFRFIEISAKSKPRYYDLNAVKSKFEEQGVPYRSPRMLRSIRLNYLLEKTGNHILVAEMGQHSPEVFLRDYSRPSLTKSIREVAVFHQLHSPIVVSPGPGICVDQAPASIEGTPSSL